MNEALKFKALFEKTHDAVFLLNLDGSHLMVNQTACTMFGYTLEEMLKMNYQSLSSEPQASSDALKRILSGERIPIYERIFRKKSGESLPVEINVVLVQDESGTPLYIQSTIRDISARKQAEAEYIERSLQKQKLRMIFESSPVGIAHYDQRGTLLDCNQKLCEISGTSRQRLIGVNVIREGTNPDMKKAFLIAQNGGVASFEDEYTTIVEKNVRYLRVIFSAITPNSLPSEVIATIEDVSDRILAKKKLEQMTAFQRLILDLAVSYVNMPLEKTESAFNDALMRIGTHCDVDRAYIFTYDATFKTFSNTLEWCREGISKEIDGLQNVPESLLTSWLEKHLKGQSVLIKNVALIVDNEPMKAILLKQNIETLITVPLLSEGHYYGFVGFDAVNRSKIWSEAEIHLLEMIAELFTNALIKKDREAYLIEARNEAQVANAVKSNFLANMSHEFRTPLNAIIGMMSLLSKTNLNTDQKKQLDQALYFSQALLETLNEILDFSKIESGKLTLEAHPFHLEDLFEEVTALMQAAATQKQLDFTYQIHPSLRHTWFGDAIRIKQIFNNLLSNAIKFTSVGQVHWCANPSENGILFSVSDTGIGLTPEEQVKIFKPFTQADQSITRKYGGTGLGLSIVKELVELMQGTIEVKSDLGSGTVFHIDLPIVPYKPVIALEAEANHASSIDALKEALLEQQPIKAQKLLFHLKDHSPIFNELLICIENYDFSTALELIENAFKKEGVQ